MCRRSSCRPGGATVAQFRLHVPGKYILADHALARMEKGLVGFLEVSGEPQAQICRAGAATN